MTDPSVTVSRGSINALIEGVENLRKEVASLNRSFDLHRVEDVKTTAKLESLSVQVEEQGSTLKEVVRTVNGSKGPPPLPGSEPLTISVPRAAAKASTAMGDVAEVKGELLAVRAELARQSQALGIGPKRIEWLPSKAVIASAVRWATLIGAVYAALHQAMGKP